MPFTFNKQKEINLVSGIMLTLSFYFAAFSAITEATEQKPIEALEPKLNFDNYQQLGQCQLSWLWLDVYKATFFTRTGKYHSDEYPQLLVITYLRNISADDLIKATVEQWQHLNYSADDIKAWQQAIKGIWPNISKNDNLSFEVINENHGRFFYNQVYLQDVKDKGFAKAFISIWLSKNTSQPKLRQQLLGQ